MLHSCSSNAAVRLLSIPNNVERVPKTVDGVLLHGRIVLIYKLSVRYSRHLGGGEVRREEDGSKNSNRSTVNQVKGHGTDW